ncbi:MAG: hypothetical protein QM675_08515 [Protaetiibacter sp.]
MSTEPGTPSATRAAIRERAGRRRFVRSWVATVAVLSVTAGVLGAASVAQGPRLSSATLNTVAAVERAGQRLVLQADQPLATVTADAVEVEPAAPVELTADGEQLTIRFTGLLRYGTEYRVKVAVNSAATGASGRLEYRFATPDVATYSLDRHDPADDETNSDGTATAGTDRVVRHSLSGATPDTVVVEAPRIQEYAPVGSVLAAVVLADDDTPSLELVSPEDGLVTEIPTPQARGIRALRVASGGDLIGYIVDGDDGTGTLYLLDLEDASWVPIEVAGPAGTPLAALDWAFVPGTTSVVVQADDEQLYLVDPVAGTTATPLGQHAELRGFLPGTVQLVVADPDGGAIIDLSDGSTTALALPAPSVPDGLYPDAFVLTSPTSFVELYNDPMGLSDAGARSILYAVDADGTRELFRPATATSRIGAVCLSPNGQYLSVEVVPGGATPDDYPNAPGWSGTTIYYVDAETGTFSRGVTGMSADWCG